MKISIYDYNQLSDYLIDFFDAKKQANPSFSFRAIAPKLGKISHSQLYQIVKGKKKFPLPLVEKMTEKLLRLNQREKRYLKTLIEIDHHCHDQADPVEIEQLQLKLKKLAPLKIEKINFDKMMSHPLTMILFEMIGRADINHAHQITAGKLLINVSQNEVDASLNFLIDSGHIKRDQTTGLLNKTVEHLMSTSDISSAYIRDYHKQVSSYAAQLIDEVEQEKREFQSYAINISQKNLPKAKELIRIFMDDFAQLMEESREADSTYNLNLQFFPLTKDQS